MKPNITFNMKQMKDYIRSNKLNHPDVRLGMRRDDMIAGLKKAGHWEEVKSKPQSVKAKVKAIEKKATPKPKPAPKPVVKTAPKPVKKELDQGQKDFLGGITDIGDSQKVNTEKSIKILKNIMKNYTGTNKDYDYVGALLDTLENNFPNVLYSSIKDLKVNKQNNKITYKLFDNVYDKFVVRYIGIEPK
tara:strand:- start:86 stop:652 length:567 start_codon:yes stop_codon:yes gene_type:complete